MQRSSWLELVDAFQYPAELAQGRNRYSNDRSVLHELLGKRTLNRVILCRRPYEDIGIGCDLHSRPTQPFSIASLARMEDLPPTIAWMDAF